MAERFEILNLPYPPSENEIYSDKMYKDKRGKWRVYRVLNKTGADYKQLVCGMLNETGMTTRLREFVNLHDTVDVIIFLYRPNWYTKEGHVSQTAGDCANNIKIIQDILFEAIGINDAHAFFSGSRKLYGAEPKAGVVFSKSPVEEDDFE